MALSTSEKYFVEDAIERFHEAIDSSSVALEHLSDFHNETKFTEVLRSERRKIFAQSIQLLQAKENSNLNQEKVVKHVDTEFQKVIEFYLEKNRSHKKQSDSLLEKLADYLCKEFRTSSELHLRRNQYTGLGSLQAFLLRTKSDLINNFASQWKPGSARFHQKWKVKLERKLDQIQKEIEEKQKLFLEGPVQDEKKLFAEMEKTLLEKCGDTKGHISSLKLDHIPKSLLEGQIEEMKKLVDENDCFRLKAHRLVHKKLLETLTVAKIGLCMAEEKLLPRDAIAWAEGLDMRLKKCVQEQKESQSPEVVQVQVQQQQHQQQHHHRSRSRRHEVELNESSSTQSSESLGNAEREENISQYEFEIPRQVEQDHDEELEMDRSATESIQDEAEESGFQNQAAQYVGSSRSRGRVSVGNNTMEDGGEENRRVDFDLKQLV